MRVFICVTAFLNERPSPLLLPLLVMPLLSLLLLLLLLVVVVMPLLLLLLFAPARTMRAMARDIHSARDKPTQTPPLVVYVDRTTTKRNGASGSTF